MLSSYSGRSKSVLTKGINSNGRNTAHLGNRSNDFVFSAVIQSGSESKLHEQRNGK